MILSKNTVHTCKIEHAKVHMCTHILHVLKQRLTQHYLSLLKQRIWVFSILFLKKNFLIR